MGDKASTPCTEDCLRDTASTSYLGKTASTPCLGETESTPCLVGGNSVNPVSSGGGDTASTPSEDSLGDKASTPCTKDSLEENIDLVQKQSGG